MLSATATDAPRTAPTSSQASPAESPLVKEPSRKQLRSLQALLKILIESPSPLQQYSLEDVKNAAYEDNSFTDAELEVVRNLANRLRAF
ncbi:hypothetical protein DFQ26_002414, partial [Actinomortierella ambigua]